MTPQEKAQQLYNKFLSALPHPETTNAAVYSIAKQCALIAVDEVFKETSNKHFIIGRNGRSGTEYWQEVKQEINKL